MVEHALPFSLYNLMLWFQVRVNTRLLYQQTKFNLLREESEGYAKLVFSFYLLMFPWLLSVSFYFSCVWGIWVSYLLWVSSLCSMKNIIELVFSVLLNFDIYNCLSFFWIYIIYLWTYICVCVCVGGCSCTTNRLLSLDEVHWPSIKV